MSDGACPVCGESYDRELTAKRGDVWARVDGESCVRAKRLMTDGRPEAVLDVFVHDGTASHLNLEDGDGIR